MMTPCVHQVTQLNFGCGLIAGMSAAAITTPVDVVYVKTVTSKSRRCATPDNTLALSILVGFEYHCHMLPILPTYEPEAVFCCNLGIPSVLCNLYIKKKVLLVFFVG